MRAWQKVVEPLDVEPLGPQCLRVKRTREAVRLRTWLLLAPLFSVGGKPLNFRAWCVTCPSPEVYPLLAPMPSRRGAAGLWRQLFWEI
eukprot:3101099-Alexandrium_andersonii.AAC.1